MLVLKYKYLIWFLLISSSLFCQEKLNSFLKPSDSLHKPRQKAVVISESAIGGLALIGLNQLWYAEYDRSSYHLVNDNNSWLQMDKIGHVYTSYQMGRFGADLLNWSGVSQKNQLIYGSTIGFVFLTSVEFLDGYSKEWGFSIGDMTANAAGTGLFVAQQLLWKEQRVTLKYSFHETRYAALHPNKLGGTLLEQTLKDYNGQTYWLSFNLYSFFKETKLPKWLNFAFGYGGEGMLSAVSSSTQQSFVNRARFRQYYLSFDVNLEAIKTKSRLLKTVFSTVNMIKFPLPTIEINNKGLDIHLFYL